jgi:hypothetical protein
MAGAKDVGAKVVDKGLDLAGGVAGAADRATGAVRRGGEAVGEHWRDIKRGWKDEFERARGHAGAAAMGAGLGGVMGAGARGLHAYLNPVKEKWYQALWRKLVGGADPASGIERFKHILRSSAEGAGQGALIGGPLGKFFYGPRMARAGRMAEEARGAYENPAVLHDILKRVVPFMQRPSQQ